jgi:hypothetical protein
LGQDVQVTSDKGVITLSLMAQKPYASGQAKTPVLGVVCQQKGKKIAHAITFSPGGILIEQEYSSFGNSTSLVLEMICRHNLLLPHRSLRNRRRKGEGQTQVEAGLFDRGWSLEEMALLAMWRESERAD